MIYLTGDTHGDFERFSKKNFPEQDLMTKEDFVIILGDCGMLWTDEKKDKYKINLMENRNFTTLFIDGNHENFEKINRYKTKRWKGGNVTKISKSIFHLRRGEIYNINNNKFFSMGGAESIDKQFRTEGVTWFKEEMPTYEEKEYGMINLEKHNFNVDYVLTHTAPFSAMSKVVKTGKFNCFYEKWMDDLKEKIKFKKWFCGHFHTNKDVNNVEFLYKKIIKLKE